MMSNVKAAYLDKGFGKRIDVVGPFALLMVDFCNAFVSSDLLGGGNIAAAASNSVPLLAEARRRNWPIAHSQIVFDKGQLRKNVWIEKVPALAGLTSCNPAAAFTAELAPLRGELVIGKSVPSAFFDSALAQWLFYRDVHSLVIAGCTTSGCVRASAIDAISYGFRPIVASDCVGDRLLSAHEASLTDLGAKYAEVMERESIARVTMR